jgi:hypothetical protein
METHPARIAYCAFSSSFSLENQRGFQDPLAFKSQKETWTHTQNTKCD